MIELKGLTKSYVTPKGRHYVFKELDAMRMFVMVELFHVWLCFAFGIVALFELFFVLSKQKKRVRKARPLSAGSRQAVG